MGSAILFVIILFIAGSAIAYMGDRLGTWVGKKRLSKFGLRPKHTAMLYTIVSGGFIAALTVIALLLFSRDVRLALFNGTQIILRLHQAQKRVVVAEGAAAKAEGDTMRAQSERLAATQAAGAAKLREAAANQREAIATQKAVQEQVKVAAADKKVQIASVEFVKKEQELAGVNSHLAIANEKLSASQNELRVAITNLGRAKAQEREAQVKAAAYQQIAHLEQHLDDRHRTRTRLLEGNRIIYHKGSEVGRTVIRTHLSESAIETRLNDWLYELSHTADKQGAARGPSGREVLVVGDGTELPGTVASEYGSLNVLAHNISDLSGKMDSVVVVARAPYNSAVGEPVRVDLQAYDNVLVFSKGEAVASGTVNGSGSYSNIRNSLMAFLSDRVKKAASDKNIIPTIDPITSTPSYGGAVNLDDIVPRIQQLGGAVNIVAVAADDVYSKGPLAVRLDVSAGDDTRSTASSGGL